MIQCYTRRDITVSVSEMCVSLDCSIKHELYIARASRPTWESRFRGQLDSLLFSIEESKISIEKRKVCVCEQCESAMSCGNES